MSRPNDVHFLSFWNCYVDNQFTRKRKAFSGSVFGRARKHVLILAGKTGVGISIGVLF